MGEVYFVLLATAFSTALIGVYLVLRNLSMTADAIGHSVVLGIVLAFLITPDLDSPYLFIGAVLMGLITVFSVEVLIKTGRIKEDAALGIIFPLFFSIGIILLSKYLRNVHLCTDTVVMGEVIMTPLRQTTFLGLGMPVALKRGIIAILINLGFIVVFYKELKVSTFDPDFAYLSGFAISILHYGLMALVSLNAVIAFDSVGAILVISFLVSPAATAIMLTKDLKWTLAVSCLISAINVTIGFYIGWWLNLNIAGITAFVGMVTYLIARSVRKDSGIRRLLRRKEQIRYMNRMLILLHIENHQGEDNEDIELGKKTMIEHLRMKQKDFDEAIENLLERKLITLGTNFQLTEKGQKAYDKMKRENGI